MFFSDCQAAFGGDLGHKHITWWMKLQPTGRGGYNRCQGNSVSDSFPFSPVGTTHAAGGLSFAGVLAGREYFLSTIGIFFHIGSIHISPESISALPLTLTWNAFSEVSEIMSMIKGRYLSQIFAGLKISPSLVQERNRSWCKHPGTPSQLQEDTCTLSTDLAAIANTSIASTTGLISPPSSLTNLNKTSGRQWSIITQLTTGGGALSYRENKVFGRGSSRAASSSSPLAMGVISVFRTTYFH